MISIIRQTMLKVINSRLGRKYLGIDQDKQLESGDKIIHFTANSYLIDRGQTQRGVHTIEQVIRDYPIIQDKATKVLGVTKMAAAALFASFTASPVLAATLETFRPDAHPETSSVDGHTRRQGVSEVWGVIRAGDATTSGDDGNIHNVWTYLGHSTTSRFEQLGRSWWGFDTSSLSNQAQFNSGSVQLYGQASSSSLVDERTCLVGGTPASTTSIGTADHNNISPTLLSNTLISASTWNTSDYNTFPLTAAGLNYINKSGATFFVGRGSDYDRAGTTPTWSINSSFVRCYTRDNGTAGTDPLLTLNYDLVSSDVSGNVPFLTGGGMGLF